MIKKSKMLGFILISIVALVGVLISASCAPPTAVESPVPTESPRIPPVVLVIPNVVAPGGKVAIVGANFEPGEKVRIGILIEPGIEFVPGAEGKGLTLEVNEVGSFQMSGEKMTPQNITSGVYPVRVYDEKGEMIASTLFVVEE